MKCLTCKKNEAIVHPTYGITDCESCLGTQVKSPSRSVEFTTDEIKWERKEYERDTIQPTRGDELSKEFIDIHGRETVKEILNVTDEQIDKAKYVWDQMGDTGNSYYKKNV